MNELETGSLAGRINPEGRLVASERTTPAFKDAVAGEDKTGIDADGENVDGEGRRLFEEIKAECRYCGRALEPDHSL